MGKPQVLVQIVPLLTERVTLMEGQLTNLQASPAPMEEQRLAEIEAQYQQRIKELEDQLAAYQQQTSMNQPVTQPSKPPKRKKKASVKKLPATLEARRAFADLHHVPDAIVASACKSGKITAVQGKWLYQSRVVYQALGDRGKHDFHQLYHQRPDFKACEHCPHQIEREKSTS
jgi:hypothetical protein